MNKAGQTETDRQTVDRQTGTADRSEHRRRKNGRTDRHRQTVKH